MKIEYARWIASSAEKYGIEGVKLQKSYSGRGMYGRSTAALTGDHQHIMGAIAATAARLAQSKKYRNNVQLFVDAMCRLSQDSMGYDVVVY